MPITAPEALRSAFEQAYGVPPAVLVRAPGRVNLIGEHTDYSNLPVLPIAIAQSLLIAAAPASDGIVEARSSAREDARFARADPHPSGAPWHRYLAGALGQLASAAPDQGARILIDGDLPAAGGLSSSSALTVGLLAALAWAWGTPLAADALVQHAIAAEHHVGVETGSMDQTVIVHARVGHATRIDFLPRALAFVPIPAGLCFVVASSGELAPKAGSARDAYNERVVGARIGASMLADEVGIDLDMPPTLGQVADIDVVDILVDGLPEKVSAQEVAHGIDVDVERLVQLTTANFDHMAKVPVKRVARHVLSEAQRVTLAERALREGDLHAFGALLNESHNSLREDFRCSTPALDRLCAAMRKAGALGARLTGAGFGGYALAACTPDALDAVLVAGAVCGGPSFEVRASGGLELL